MAKLTVEMPDELARRLNNMAAAQRRSVQELALQRLRSLVETIGDDLLGSAAAVLHAMRAPPRLNMAEVDELEAAIAAGRLPVRTGHVFPDDRR